jgi:heavy metal sensor kinase
MSPGARALTIRTRLTLWYAGVLLAILVVTGALSYSVLRFTLLHDVDASLLTVAHVIQETGQSTAPRSPGLDPEALLRELLGPELYDKFFQLRDPDGAPRFRSRALPARELPLSAAARAAAARGERTFETVELGGDDVRLLTLPVMQDRRVAQLVQVAMSLDRTRQAFHRYVQTLLVLIPLGVGLAALGGAALARRALRPVDEMTRTARQITATRLGRRVDRRGTGDELDRLADTLNGMLVRLETAFSELRRFSADAAHELRTPLTALQGGLEVALRADRSADEYRHVLVSSLEEVKHLGRLAEDLLLLSRATAGLETPRARVELEPLLLDALETGMRLAQGKEVGIRLKDVTPATVTGDGAALGRALRNLVENAVKYTPGGGAVELSLLAGDHEAALVVQDTGVGIDPADAARVFEPFVRLDAARSRDTGGTGLGLAIARSIVTAHGGTLTLESTPGAGSRFTIRLPR